MTAGRLARLWRYPIKSHGREPLQEVVLAEGATMPGDRVWAVAHEASKATAAAWAPCANFSRAAKAAALQAIRSTWDEATGRIRLTHPDLADLDFDPETEPQRLIDWAAPLMPPNRAQSARLLRVPGRGMTDTEFPSLSLINAASHRALSAAMGQELSPERWRGNLLIEGLEPWQEFDWIGRKLALGAARLEVRQRITRCNATKANPDTGRSDADTLGALKSGWGHQDFGSSVTVSRGGRVALGDALDPV
jgi:uncharacterized protein YcbX